MHVNENEAFALASRTILGVLKLGGDEKVEIPSGMQPYTP